MEAPKRMTRVGKEAEQKVSNKDSRPEFADSAARGATAATMAANRVEVAEAATAAELVAVLVALEKGSWATEQRGFQSQVRWELVQWKSGQSGSGPVGAKENCWPRVLPGFRPKQCGGNGGTRPADPTSRAIPGMSHGNEDRRAKSVRRTAVKGAAA